jgi:riboflavin kinase/FMN adenylyltransferase
MLGHPYSIAGRVARGRQLGRTIGVPTANIQLHRYKAPLSGVYAVEITGLTSGRYGVANVGVRPTIDGDTIRPILEVHIFDFDADIYGQYIEIIFRKKIREEKKYDGLEALKEAISKDMKEARQFFLLDA